MGPINCAPNPIDVVNNSPLARFEPTGIKQLSIQRLVFYLVVLKKINKLQVKHMIMIPTLVPTKSDSDVILCLQLLS